MSAPQYRDSLATTADSNTRTLCTAWQDLRRMHLPDFEEMRTRMVSSQLANRGIRDQRVIDAMAKVPRELFVPESYRDLAYADRPLPIAAEQTISQPHVVAYMIEALAIEKQAKVLEVGAGSGYAAAVLSKLAGEVFAIERIDELAQHAASNLQAGGYMTVHVKHGDGTLGWPEHAPYDAILVSAAASTVPEALKMQLKTGGKMVVPVGSRISIQQLIRITRLDETGFAEEELAAVRFVPLISDEK